MATKQTTIRMSDATRAKADELARRYGTITEVVAVAIDRMYREVGIMANFISLNGGDVVVWEGPGWYGPRQEGQRENRHMRWYQTNEEDFYLDGLNTPTWVDKPEDLA